jgi:hypothetical protein
MNKKTFFFLTLCCFINSFAQTSFIKGSYVTDKDQKVEGLIKNLDWKNNPTQFEFKSSESSKAEILKITSIKSFEIDNKVKYVKSKVNIDNSSTFVNSLSTEKAPIYTEETVFLKTLVQGDTNLYEYNSATSKLFFYQADNGIVIPLIYKKYFIDNNRVAENNEYKDQLKQVKSCNETIEKEIGVLKYTTKDLTVFFTKANSCNGGSVNYQSITESEKKNLFHVTLRPGINFSSYSVESNVMPDFYNANFDNKTSFRFGVEAEFVLPFNNNKLAVIIEPTYQYYNADKILDAATNRGVRIKYSSIELPVGLRYYMFLDKNSKIFVNALGVFDAVLGKSKLEYDNTFVTPGLKSSMNMAFGIGYKYADRYNVEFRINSKRDMLPGGTSMESKYKNFSIIFGYTLF